MKKLILTLMILLVAAGIVVQASDLVIESKTQSYSEQENKLKFNGNVKVSVDDLKVVGDRADVTMNEDQKLDTATFYDKPYAYEVKKNKKREVKANILKMSLITKVVKAQGDTQSIVFDGKTPVVVINANEQEYDTKTGIMTATGTVTIKYKDLDTFSDKAKVRTDKNGDLKDIELIGNARIKQESNDSYADRQEYAQDRNIFNASGNVRVWYQDYYAVGPKLTLYPNKEGKPNEAYFTGRSSITQGVRTIYADKIKMSMKPKDFHADGNTRTVIKNIGSGDNGNSDGGIGLGL